MTSSIRTIYQGSTEIAKNAESLTRSQKFVRTISYYGNLFKEYIQNNFTLARNYFIANPQNVKYLMFGSLILGFIALLVIYKRCCSPNEIEENSITPTDNKNNLASKIRTEGKGEPASPNHTNGLESID